MRGVSTQRCLLGHKLRQGHRPEDDLEQEEAEHEENLQREHDKIYNDNMMIT